MKPLPVGLGSHQPGSVPLSLSEVSRAALGMAVGVNQVQIIRRVHSDAAGPREYELASLD